MRIPSASAFLISIINMGLILSTPFVGSFYKDFVVVISTIKSLDFTKVTSIANYMEGYSFSFICYISLLREAFNYYIVILHSSLYLSSLRFRAEINSVLLLYLLHELLDLVADKNVFNA